MYSPRQWHRSVLRLDAAAKFAKVFYDSNRQDALAEASAQIKEAMIKHLYDPHLKRFIKGIYPNGERDITIDSSISTVFACEVLDAKDDKSKEHDGGIGEQPSG